MRGFLYFPTVIGVSLISLNVMACPSFGGKYSAQIYENSGCSVLKEYTIAQTNCTEIALHPEGNSGYLSKDTTKTIVSFSLSKVRVRGGTDKYYEDGSSANQSSFKDALFKMDAYWRYDADFKPIGVAAGSYTANKNNGRIGPKITEKYYEIDTRNAERGGKVVVFFYEKDAKTTCKARIILKQIK